MRIALAQMSMRNHFNENYKTTQQMIDEAAGCQLLVFPLLQLCPYFPQLKGLKADAALSHETDARMSGIAFQAQKNNMYIAPNVYLETNHKKFCATLFYDKHGAAQPSARQMHVEDHPDAFEKGYFDEGNSGFIVHETSMGKVGIVVGNDLHYPESARVCALKGADLIIVPAAIADENLLSVSIAEVRAQAYENHVFMALCNRTGREGKLTFKGHSVIVGPDGKIILEADEKPQVLRADLDLTALKDRETRFAARRPDQYGLLVKTEQESVK